MRVVGISALVLFFAAATLATLSKVEVQPSDLVAGSPKGDSWIKGNPKKKVLA